ncbi:hypothetical protein HYC85_031560 [Camellia sinensis]|uniref:Uncharacterized protein n=1 Tax=Camellia sinensis TaxID=4442 RepID=A0A7J7FRJ8_CAMSI|nr:hypothetical protein HYC85_031560 [Camellia sinensis]
MLTSIIKPLICNIYSICRQLVNWLLRAKELSALLYKNRLHLQLLLKQRRWRWQRQLKLQLPEKRKPPAKAPAKALPELMEEEVIPLLKETLGSQDDISELELSFEDNKLEGSFLKRSYPYSFWAFFPDGVLIGPKGFSLSSYGYEASTVEPFLIDEKKITAKHVVFWVEKRLAAQGIIPVWKE